MTTTLQKWGNSLAVRIPKSLADELNLAVGQSVQLSPAGRELLIRHTPATQKRHTKGAWRSFVIPTNKKSENVSGAINEILYETPAR